MLWVWTCFWATLTEVLAKACLLGFISKAVKRSIQMSFFFFFSNCKSKKRWQTSMSSGFLVKFQPLYSEFLSTSSPFNRFIMNKIWFRITIPAVPNHQIWNQMYRSCVQAISNHVRNSKYILNNLLPSLIKREQANQGFYRISWWQEGKMCVDYNIYSLIICG